MMPQLLMHIFADYITQSDWQALNKSKRTIPCLVHIILYTSCFLFLTTSWKALLVIGSVHFILDRFPIIIKKLIWYKNHINPTLSYPWFDMCDTTGYFDDSPYNTSKEGFTEEGICRRHFYITVWLYIITDNFLHLLTNYLALKYL